MRGLVGACSSPPAFCVITEFLSGGSLGAFLHKLDHKALPLDKIISISLDIARGMAYIHSEGVVHRDVKPDNIIFDEEFSAKIVDFGVACEEDHCEPLANDTGTFRWMAPEMMKHKAYGRKVDVYSFGLILWQMFSGTIPYEELNPFQAAFAVFDKNVRPKIPTSCPAPVRLLIEQCWASHPEKRPDFCQIVQILKKFKTVLDRDGTLDNMPSSICQETRDHKNWLAHWVQKLKHSHIMSSVVTSHHSVSSPFQTVLIRSATTCNFSYFLSIVFFKKRKTSTKKGRPGAVVRAVSLSHQVMGSKQPLRRFCGGKACLGFSLSQTPLMWEPPALGLPF
ncbi:serine/threonine/tyrosine-protein kinase HT1-like [Miscanthus floridulus]|uniref:serine/threonine/tyrosine-protein kinase HT1-like n=1 Tax=Miscanthus floridulus TaxID=154761 RepID=UPI00345A940D